jgi:alpha-glucosidase
MRVTRFQLFIGLSVLGLLTMACTSPQRDAVISVTAPDGRTTMTFELADGVPAYRVVRDGMPLIDRALLGVVLADGASFDTNLVLVRRRTGAVDDSWVQPWGEVAEVRDHHNELQVELRRSEPPQRRMQIIFRVFDDGVGFRYAWPEQPELGDFAITDELTEFALTSPYDAWWIPAYRENRYEYLYTRSPGGSLDTVHTPLTLEPSTSTQDAAGTARPYLSIHESDLTDYASMTLMGVGASTGGGVTLEVDLVPWSDGVKVRATAPHASPWRTIQIADTPADLAESTLILNLAEPNRLGDVSWVEPGKYVGIWWGMHIGKNTWESGAKHGATTANAKRYIDFAASNGFAGVLVEGWNIGWDGNWLENGSLFRFTEPYPDFDLEEVQRYALERGVSLIGHHETSADVLNYEAQMEDAFALYQRLGIKAVKTGYVGFGQNINRGNGELEWHHGQYMVRHYRKVIETAARYGIMIDVHEPIKDTGIRCTFPNMMTREGARGQEYNSGAGVPNPLEHVPVLAFTRMLSGPFDYTPGVFAVRYPEYRPNHRMPSTLARQLALYVVLYSPLHMAADLVENYEAHERESSGTRSAFQFIRDVPVDWEYTYVPDAAIGDYAVFVRKDRHSADWYLGAVTDEQARSVDVTLDFLPSGESFVAEIYGDGAGADWETNPYAIDLRDEVVTSTSILTLSMGRGGGYAIRFRPAGE